MWLLDWLIDRWNRVYEIFETWYWRIRDAVDTYWAQFWYVVVVWYNQAYIFFREKVSQLWDVVIWWYGRIRAVILDYWGTLWQALTASWGYIWDHFYQGYKDIIDYAYSARADIIDTFTRFKYNFQAFRNHPFHFIIQYMGGDIRVWDYFVQHPVDYIELRVSNWIDLHVPWVRDIIGHIVGQIGWLRANWNLFWFNPAHYIIALMGGDTQVWDYFVAHPVDYIQLLVSNWLDAHFPWLDDIIGYIIQQIGWVRANWNLFWFHPLHYLITLAGGDTRVWDYFIAHPVAYIHILVTNWLEEWAEAIGNTIADVVEWLILLITGIIWGLLEGSKNWMVGYLGSHTELWWAEEWIREGRYRLFEEGADAPGGYKFWANYFYEKTYGVVSK